MSKKADPIRFQAQVRSIKTLAGSGADVTLSLSDKDLRQIFKLLECKKTGAVLDITAVPIKPDVKVKEKNGTKKQKRIQRYPYRAEA